MSKEITKEDPRPSFINIDKKAKKDKLSKEVKKALKAELKDEYDAQPIETLLLAILLELQK